MIPESHNLATTRILSDPQYLKITYVAQKCYYYIDVIICIHILNYMYFQNPNQNPQPHNLTPRRLKWTKNPAPRPPASVSSVVGEVDGAEGCLGGYSGEALRALGFITVLGFRGSRFLGFGASGFRASLRLLGPPWIWTSSTLSRVTPP